MSDDQPLITTGYGQANLGIFDDAGGLSAAAADIARVLVALNIRKSNPMLLED